jgi:hypothetical protein
MGAVEPIVINGPVIEAPGREIVYQVTLSSGMVVTGPVGFGAPTLQVPLTGAVPTPPKPTQDLW